MKYVFEKGEVKPGLERDGLEKQDDFIFDSNEEAIKFLESNGYDYVWNCPEDSNPNWSYRKGELNHDKITR